MIKKDVNLPKELCCACEVCSNICSHNAISFVADSIGFRYAKIDQNKCIRCHQCEKVCPIISSSFTSDNYSVVAGYSKNQRIVEESSSGGFFSIIAEKFIISGGCVVGVAWSSDFRVARHILIDKVEELPPLKKSKYVQSRKEQIYNECKSKLKDGKKVLFIGTPCEVAAIVNYLPKNLLDNLYTIDFVCQGPTSEKAYKEYFDYIEKKFSSKIVYVNMRRAIGPWIPQFLHIKFANGKEFTDRLYETPLGDSIRIMQRRSCFSCTFNGNGRASDLTFGDYHGADPQAHYYNESGVSIAISHSQHGEYLLSLLNGVTNTEEVSYLELARFNPCLENHWPPREGYDIFVNRMGRKGLFEASAAVVPLRYRIMRKIPWKLRETLKRIKSSLLYRR